MQLVKAKINNFRNLDQVEIEFQDRNFLIGDNAQGKTNILEAIHYLSNGSSFRSRQDNWLVQHNKNSAMVECDFIANQQTRNITIAWQKIDDKITKLFKLNGAKISRAKLLGNLLTVLFSPDDTALLRMQPSQRRAFLDALIAKTDKVYYADWLDYLNTLKQRNQLLKLIKQNMVDIDELIDWDHKISETGSRIVRKRHKLIQEISGLVNQFFQQIYGSERKVTLTYTTSVDLADPTNYLNYLQQRRIIETKIGFTMFGPHRDDLEIFLGGWDARQMASQGEFRLLVLALKLAEGEYLKQQTKETPIYLLDDVFSELDATKNHALINCLQGLQVVFTTVDHRFTSATDNIIEIDHGAIKKVEYELAEISQPVA